MDRFYWNAIELKSKLEEIERHESAMSKHRYEGWEGDLERDVAGLKEIALKEYHETLKEIKSVEVAHG